MSENEKKDAEVKEEPKAEAIETKAETNDGKAPELNIDDAKRTGIKDAVVDSDTVAIEKEKDKEPEKVMMPSFFVSDAERRKIEVDILSVKETGKIVSVSRAGMGLDFKEFPFLMHRKEWFEFTVPSYEDMSTYRQRCAQWRKEANQMLVDRLQLRHYFLVWHLKDWSLVDKEGKKIVLTFDNDESLSAESLAIALTMQPTILDIVFTAFEKDILLI